MDRYLLAQLIKRYRSGQATEQERYLLEEIWKSAELDTSTIDSLSSQELETLKVKIFASTRRRIQEIEKTKRSRRIRPWVFSVAASVSLAIIASVVVFWYASRPREIRTGFGERLAVTLPDQSTVTLNGNSVLRFNKVWNDHDRREVWIDGEGFFAVKHTKSNQKFIVHASSQLNVEVLGTKFNVKSRDLKSEVMLTEGKVKLDVQNAPVASVFLKPGELATMSDKKLSKRAVKDRQYTSWLNYTLLFDRTTLREAAILLKDTYGLHVTFKDEGLEDRELSGEISSANVDDILLAISQIFNLKVERNGYEVTISSKTNSNN